MPDEDDGYVLACPKCGANADRWSVIGWHQDTYPCHLCGKKWDPNLLLEHGREAMALWERFMQVNGISRCLDLHEARSGLAAFTEIRNLAKRLGATIYRLDDRHTLKFWKDLVREAEEDLRDELECDLDDGQTEDEFDRLEAARVSHDPKAVLRVYQGIHAGRDLFALEWKEVGEQMLLLGNAAQAAEAFRRAIDKNEMVGVQARLAKLEKELAEDATR